MQKLSIIVIGISLLASTSLFAHSKVVTHQGNHLHQGKMSNHSNPQGMTDCQMAIIKQAKQDGLSKTKVKKMIHAFKASQDTVDC